MFAKTHRNLSVLINLFTTLVVLFNLLLHPVGNVRALSEDGLLLNIGLNNQQLEDTSLDVSFPKLISPELKDEKRNELFKVESAQASLGQLKENLAPSLLTISSTYYVDSVRTVLTQNSTGGTLYVDSVSGFSQGDEVLVISMTSNQTGQYETAFINTVLSNTLELTSELTYSYDTVAGSVMVQKVPHLGEVVVASGGNITAHPWDVQPAVWYFSGQIVYRFNLVGKLM